MHTHNEPITIGALYSCQGCGANNEPVHVPARRNGEDVATWMGATVDLLRVAHRRRSPVCDATAFGEIKIPVAGASQIGGPTI